MKKGKFYSFVIMKKSFMFSFLFYPFTFTRQKIQFLTHVKPKLILIFSMIVNLTEMKLRSCPMTQKQVDHIPKVVNNKN